MTEKTTPPLVVSAEEVKQLLVALGPVIRAAGFEVVPERTVTTIIGLLSAARQDRGRSWELEAAGVLGHGRASELLRAFDLGERANGQ